MLPRKEESKEDKDYSSRTRHNFEKECAVRDAILSGDIESVKLFLTAGIKPSTLAYSNGHSGCLSSLISFAVKTGDLAMVQLLVDRGAEIRPKDSFHGDDSAITEAVEGGHTHIAKYLLEKGAAAKGVVYHGIRTLTFLAEASRQGNIPLVELLIQHGAKVENAICFAKEKFSQEISRCYTNKKEALNATYRELVKLLMDHAVGVDFSKEKKRYSSSGNFGGITFLENMDVAGFNFVGISVAGLPITKEMLLEKKAVNTDKALLTVHDLKQNQSKQTDIIVNQLNAHYKIQGQLLDSKGIVNLVPLWRAAEVGDEKAVITRLNAGVDPNEVGNEGEIPIILAAQNGYLNIVKLLLYHFRFNKKMIVDAIRAAKKAKNTEIEELLLSKQDINQTNEKGDALLHHAVIKGNVEEVKKLIQQGADVNLEGSSGCPLHIAARKSFDKRYFGKPSPSHVEIVRILLEYKADPNELFDEHSPLDEAASSGSLEAMKLLLPHNLKITKTIEYNEEIITYPWYGKMIFDSYGSPDWLDILKLLRLHGANFNIVHETQHETILHRVMREFPDDLPDENVRYIKQLKIFNFLLENGASSTIINDRGNTPIHEFLTHIKLNHLDSYVEIIDRCIEYGFKIDTVNERDQTLLHIAALKGSLVAISYLLSRSANINAQDNKGRTPLFYAAAGSPETTRYLIEAGAHITIRDKEGLTPLEFSKKSCQSDASIYTFSSESVKEDFVLPYKRAQDILFYAGLRGISTQHDGLFSFAAKDATIAAPTLGPILR